jgi:hypothetical protein
MTMRLVGTPRVESPYGKGSTIWFYDPGTLTAKDVFSDDAKTVPIDQTNGIAADQAGIWPEIVLDGSLYRVIVKDANGVTKQDVDNFDPGLAAGFGVTSVVGVAQGGTGASNAAAARTNIGAASSAALTVTQDTVTDHGELIATGLHEDGDRFGDLAKEDEVTHDQLASGFGSIMLQRVVVTTKQNSSTTASIPVDTSKPQISEGTQLYTQSFTPLSASSKIVIKVLIQAQGNANSQWAVFPLFKNSDADALACEAQWMSNNGGTVHISYEYEENSGSVASRTYSVRMGTNTGTLIPDSPTFGGVQVSRMIIEEWLAV